MLSECKRVADLFGLTDVRGVEEEALRMVRNPQLAPDEFTPEQIEGEREVMYAVARKRGVPLEDCKAEIDRLVDSLIASVEAQRGR